MDSLRTPEDVLRNSQALLNDPGKPQETQGVALRSPSDPRRAQGILSSPPDPDIWLLQFDRCPGP
eukprot:2553091-Pyramimonas_sp.AAC.1